MQRAYQRPERRNGSGHLRPLARCQGHGRRGEAPKPACAPRQQQGTTPCRGFNAETSRVLGVDATAGESGALEAIHQTRHRGRTHALGARECAEGLGSAKREDRECREQGGADPRALVFDPHPAQQRDGQSVELVELRGDADHGGAAPGGPRGGLRGTGGKHRIFSNTN